MYSKHKRLLTINIHINIWKNPYIDYYPYGESHTLTTTRVLREFRDVVFENVVIDNNRYCQQIMTVVTMNYGATTITIKRHIHKKTHP